MISLFHPTLLSLYDLLLPPPSPKVPSFSSLTLSLEHPYLLNLISRFEEKYFLILSLLVELDVSFPTIEPLKEALLVNGIERADVRCFIIDLTELLLIIYFSHPLVLASLPLLPSLTPITSSILPE